MKDALIKNYIDKLKVKDVNDFAFKNGLSFNNEELNYIYNIIKKDWRTIAYGNPRSILDDVKNRFDLFTYQKIEKLYIEFKNRFQ